MIAHSKHTQSTGKQWPLLRLRLAIAHGILRVVAMLAKLIAPEIRETEAWHRSGSPNHNRYLVRERDHG